jgi:acetylglutamate/LysW-gamma-L-alpha-aminoadipate kinase
MGESVAVVKLGGSVVADLSPSSWDDFAALAVEHRVIVVHGWSRPLLRWQAARGVVAEFRTSQTGYRSRLTDEAVIADILHVCLELREKMCSELTARGVHVHSFVAADTGLISADVRPQRWWIDGKLCASDNLVGQVREISPAGIAGLLTDTAAMPLLTPLARGCDHPYVNVDADHAAAAIAAAAQASLLVMLTDVPGVRIDDSVVRVLRTGDLADVRSQINGGMAKKVRAAERAIAAGVPTAVIGDGALSELMAGRSGTRVVA